MNYLKLNENQSIIYPYSIDQLKNENPNTSFPEKIDQLLLDLYGVKPVLPVNHENDYTKNYIELHPVLIDDKFYQNWETVSASQQEIDSKIYNQWEFIRKIRNQYLQDCDWTQLADSPLSEEKKEEWSIYRQELRDVTLQEDPFNIVFPTKPL
jgi:hypothetical protein